MSLSVIRLMWPLRTCRVEGMSVLTQWHWKSSSTNGNNTPSHPVVNEHKPIWWPPHDPIWRPWHRKCFPSNHDGSGQCGESFENLPPLYPSDGINTYIFYNVTKYGCSKTVVWQCAKALPKVNTCCKATVFGRYTPVLFSLKYSVFLFVMPFLTTVKLFVRLKKRH